VKQNLIENIDSGDVYPVTLYHIHQVIRSDVRLTYGNIAVIETVFAQDSLDFVVVDIRQGHRVGNGNATLVFLPHLESQSLYTLLRNHHPTYRDIGRLLVQTNAKSF
jgi:hypothetical protein